MPNVQLRNTLLLMGASFIWGTAFVAQSVGADHMGPYSFLAGRSWLACVFLLGLMAVLRKAGPLTDAEWEEMRRCPVTGYDILRKVPQFQQVALIVRHHHERWDGRGYPDQLVGEQIPIAAQVVGLADAYETLTTGSGSQPPVPCAAAVQMLCTGEAGAFNPVLLDCLREIENEIDDAMRRRPETL